MKAHVVIDAGYGDSGKGLMTDYFCSLYDSNRVLNIKVNGGCQAGHTACVLDKISNRYNINVFHTLGSGTFRGVDTFLASKFILNIKYLNEELKKFEHDFGWKPIVLASEQCRIQFKIDEELNHRIEETRSNKHGTCGKGIYETVNRHHQNLGIQLYKVYDRFIANEKEKLCNKISELSLQYIEYREQFIKDSENLSINTQDLKDDIDKYSKETVDDIWEFLQERKNQFCMTTFDRIIASKKYEVLVFECSQGLELNWGDKRNTPHTTASHTGLTNVVKEIKQSKKEEPIENIEICYVTRSYKTKHGAGNFVELDSSIIDEWGLYDKTNRPNKFQGTLAYGKIDRQRMTELINTDFKQLDSLDIPIKTKSLAVTHLDQTNEAVLENTGETFFKDFNAHNIINGEKTYYSFGEKATDIITE